MAKLHQARINCAEDGKEHTWRNHLGGPQVKECAECHELRWETETERDERIKREVNDKEE